MNKVNGMYDLVGTAALVAVLPVSAIARSVKSEVVEVATVVEVVEQRRAVAKDVPQKPNRPSPGEGSLRARFWSPTLSCTWSPGWGSQERHSERNGGASAR